MTDPKAVKIKLIELGILDTVQPTDLADLKKINEQYNKLITPMFEQAAQNRLDPGEPQQSQTNRPGGR